MARKKPDPNYKVIAENRRARFDYAIEDDIECGIVLEGSEVKSLREKRRQHRRKLRGGRRRGTVAGQQLHPPYEQAKTFGHAERRRRKLLVSRKELADLWNATRRKGMTLVPLVLYFNHKGLAKLKLGIARGKKIHDKRETQAKRDWTRQKQRLLKDHG
ncbi:SsrA-binding protein SmpB [Jhaorihella thermophila]